MTEQSRADFKGHEYQSLKGGVGGLRHLLHEHEARSEWTATYRLVAHAVAHETGQLSLHKIALE